MEEFFVKPSAELTELLEDSKARRVKNQEISQMAHDVIEHLREYNLNFSEFNILISKLCEIANKEFCLTKIQKGDPQCPH